MKILIYSLNHYPELTGIGKYNGDMAKMLSQKGLDVSVLCAPPYYPEWKVGEGYSGKSYKTEHVDGATVYRCPLYVPGNVTTVKRLIHLCSFAVSSGMRLLSLLFKKYDVVFLVQPTFFCAPLTLLYCRLTGAKAVMHIQDYELDAMLGLGMAKAGFVSRMLKKAESWALRRFDTVSSISYSMLELARQKGVADEKTLLFPNWANTDFVTPDTPGHVFRHTHGFNKSDSIVLYAGNMGHKQGLEVILDAAEDFRGRRNIKFVLVGTGAYVDTLKELAAKKSLENVIFLPLQEWEDVPAMLSAADIHLVVQKRGAADVVLPSKLTNILAAGGEAIITADADTELGKLSAKFDGIYNLIEPECSRALSSAIKAQLQVKCTDFNQVARNYAEEHLEQDNVLSRFVQQMKDRFGIKDSNDPKQKKPKLDPIAFLEDDETEVLDKYR